LSAPVEGASGATGEPQLLQKRAVADTSAPQEGQRGVSELPHASQNRASPLLAWPHSAQFTDGIT
jgi:hypothetical protein